TGGVDIYPEYTGTVSQVIMKASGRPSVAEMRAFLTQQGIGISDPLGFNDGYALAVTQATQSRYNLHKISDLAQHPDLQLGFTHEFVGRPDGFKGLSERYGLSMHNVRGMEHALAYAALLHEAMGAGMAAAPQGRGVLGDIAHNTLRHVQLVAISLVTAILFGIPLGVLATRSRLLATVTLAGAGLLQTIPSMALLA